MTTLNSNSVLTKTHSFRHLKKNSTICNKMEKKQKTEKTHVGTIPKSHRQIVETEENSYP